ncbi:MAG: UDP-N-acetylglucosamine 1-carboxyvinyltransferase [Candidatus Cloacimonetes bacterium]|nr:UDP-N-acetylglucosamine 1-carboxyvinyltransferase [Candidatus Cloacimonadota bacterium]MCF7813204.1 UDP-N-acetylglucosamine 1-carboxyvinyltransferase [Candidatus Cloacimonadota bacterium]MCF7867403.1 UDP-N-acetylglucosamine 1-carboxyvinyltransferase [Candidatus Cloacimonadota bacterium]MCF7882965.1 UDP-N-acetylglucosamine 1-carboxyvinyltransferase [Candidatus Cloacimonadota bacterium]
MDKFIINGGKTLSGSVQISGAKNAILPIMAASLLAKGKSVLHNVPHLNDIKMMAHVMRVIGARIDFEDNTMEIDATHASFCEAPYELVSKMRASIYVMGPLLARFGTAKVSFPGGCAIGTRPVDLHLMAMEALKAEITIEHGYIFARTKKLKGGHITFPKVSVGATANALMATVMAKGETNIYNAAIEPEIGSLIDFLNLMGANIKGKNTDHLQVTGVKELHPAEMEMIPDRIEAGTFVIAGAITKSPITIENCIPDHIQILLEKLKETGCNFEINDNSIKVIPAENILPTDIQTQPYPLFPTDLQAQFLALMTLANGTSIIEDTIFPDRFMHVAELNRLDADIIMNKNVATINGVKSLSGAEVMATDLRASAALVLAGLAASGQTTISRIYHIDRGYERIEEKLKKMGADIKRKKG